MEHHHAGRGAVFTWRGERLRGYRDPAQCGGTSELPLRTQARVAGIAAETRRCATDSVLQLNRWRAWSGLVY
jgi:hypothetical protein